MGRKNQTKVDKTRLITSSKCLIYSQTGPRAYIVRALADKNCMGVPAIKDSEIKNGDTKIFEMKPDSVDLGSSDSLRRHVLTWVLEGCYEKAIEQLKLYLETDSEYPGFKEKVIRYINHSVDLIYAIKAKRGFPGLSSLTRSKQHELREKFIEHFKELQHILKTVEKIEYDMRLHDVRSTVYVVKAAWIAGLAIIIFAFGMDIVHGLANASLIVFDDGLVRLADWLASLIGF